LRALLKQIVLEESEELPFDQYPMHEEISQLVVLEAASMLMEKAKELNSTTGGLGDEIRVIMAKINHSKE
jgi:hypothetical protein